MIRVLIAIATLATAGRASSEAAALQQDVYVWQRAWTDSVTNAVATLAPRFGALIALQAEVSWSRGTPRCTRAALDYATLRSTGKPVGLALRIGSFSGPFSREDDRTAYLTRLCRALVAEARANQLKPVELHLDFDCAESRLEGYRVWLTAIQEAVRPIPVTLTALPSWLHQPAFRSLARTADGYVLQVHSFERPRDPDARFTLCDPQAAQRAVTQASRIGRPFRVALPTYGYLAAFDPQDQFLGLSAEGPAPGWPDSARVVEVRADAVALAGLVNEWSANGPAELVGLVWYRLPVPGDVLNWRWPTLRTVMAGTPPAPDVRVEIQRPQPGLIEIRLLNAGTADAAPLPAVHLHCSAQRRIAADGIGGFQLLEDGPARVRFHPGTAPQRLPAGERLTLGWIRFERDPEINVELHETQD